MKSIIKFLRLIYQQLRIIWIIEIKYPKSYQQPYIKSIVPEKILTDTFGLFIGKNVTIKNPDIKIGKHTFIGNDTIIDSCKEIGAFCSISSDVKIGLRNHPIDWISTSPVFYSKYRNWTNKTFYDEKYEKTVIIEDDVLISANVIIINGIKIGRGAIIGAGAIVTKDVPPYAIVAGNPAKIIRYRFNEELIKKIEFSKWWETEDKKLHDNILFANNPELFLSKI